MDFINFEAKVDNIDDDEQEHTLSDDDAEDSFIDDASDISESVCKLYAFQDVEVNPDEVLIKVHEKPVSDLCKTSEVTNFSNDLVDKLPEIIEFSGSQKRINEFEKKLLIPHGVGCIDSFFYAVCFAVRYAKVEKPADVMNFKVKQNQNSTKNY